MTLKMGLMVRPWSCHQPKQAGYEPIISGKTVRIGRRKRNGWRWQVFVDDQPMAFGHCDTKRAAESSLEPMLDAYTEAHYVSE